MESISEVLPLKRGNMKENHRKADELMEFAENNNWTGADLYAACLIIVVGGVQPGLEDTLNREINYWLAITTEGRIERQQEHSCAKTHSSML